MKKKICCLLLGGRVLSSCGLMAACEKADYIINGIEYTRIPEGIMAMIDRQYGFALELAGRGEERFGKPIYRELAACTLKKMPFWRPVLRKCCRKFLKF